MTCVRCDPDGGLLPLCGFSGIHHPPLLRHSAGLPSTPIYPGLLGPGPFIAKIPKIPPNQEALVTRASGI